MADTPPGRDDPAMPGNAPAPPAVTATRRPYVSPWLAVREDTLLLPDGSSATYAVVERRDFAIVIPRTDEGLVLVEQYRHPLGRRSLEFPQGSDPGDPDRPPAEVARTELAEETGMRAGTLRALGHVHLATGLSPQAAHVFLATDLRPGPTAREPLEQDMTVHVVSVERFRELVASGAIDDAATLAAWARYLAVANGAFDAPEVGG